MRLHTAQGCAAWNLGNFLGRARKVTRRPIDMNVPLALRTDDLDWPTEYNAIRLLTVMISTARGHETHPNHRHVVIEQSSIPFNHSGHDLRWEVDHQRRYHDVYLAQTSGLSRSCRGSL